MPTGRTTMATPPAAGAARRPRPWIAFFAFGAAATPLAVYAGRLLLHRPPMFLGNDVALVELATREAAHGVRLLGPYSRFGWHHPGPAWFFLLAGPYQALGAHSWSLLVAVALFHAAALAGLVYVAWRQGGGYAVLLMAVLVLAYMHAAGVFLFIYPWNPWALILPLYLLIVLGASDFARPVPRLLWMATIGSVLVQTHVGTAPTVVVILGTTVALTILREARARTRWRPVVRLWPPPRPAVLVPGLLLVLLWLPPVVEQVTHQTGNLGLLLKFAASGSPGHGVGDAISAVGSQLRRLPFERERVVNAPVPTGPADGFVLAAYLGLGLLLAVLGHRRGDRFAFGLGVLTLAALGAAVISVTRITGDVFDFLVTWVSVLPLPLWLGFGHLALSRWPTRRPGRVIGATVVAVGLIPLASNVSSRVAEGPLRIPDIPEVSASWPMVEAGLGPHRRRVLIRIASPNRWSVANGLALQLTKRGWDVAVDDDQLFMFSDRQRRTGREQVEVVLADAADPAARSSGGRLLGVAGGTRIEMRTLPPQLAAGAHL